MRSTPLLTMAAFVAALGVASWVSRAPAASSSSPPTPPTPREVPERGSLAPHAVSDPTARIREGDVAPDFELDGSKGRAFRLSSLRGDWVARVVADRLETLPALSQVQGDLRKLGVRAVGVCREKASRVQTPYTRELPILILADATGEVGSLYGLRPDGNSTTRPAFLLLDRRGVVKQTVTGQALSAEQIRDLATVKIKGS